MIPLNVIFGNETYKEEVELKKMIFMRWLVREEIFRKRHSHRSVN